MLQSSLADQIPQIILFKEITLTLCEKKNNFVFSALTLCISRITAAPLVNTASYMAFPYTAFPFLFYRPSTAKEGEERDPYQLQRPKFCSLSHL